MPRAAPLFLALDQGGHASRAIVFDQRGHIVAAAEKKIRTQRRGTERVEHDPAELLASLRSVCADIARQLGKRMRRVRCAGLATQRSTLVCWERGSGRALSPVISWQDRRAARALAKLAGHAPTVRRVTGLVLSPHYGASKLAWCLKNLPSVRRALQEQQLVAGPLASFILANLLEEKPVLADPVNASRTLLWDYRRRDWSPALLRLFAIPKTILPTCVPNAHPFGHLVLAGRWIPLTVVTGDQPAVLFANGQPEARDAYVNIGTGAFLQQLYGAEPPRVRNLLGSVLWQDRRRVAYVLEGTVNGAGSAFEWLRRRLGVSASRMFAGLPAWLDSRDHVPLFLNGVSGLGSPYWRAGFRSRFIGRSSCAAKFTAVTESIVFLLCVNLERMATPQHTARRIVLSGGLARLTGLCQRLADLSGLLVLRPEQHEATARGLAVLLGMPEPRGSQGRVWVPCANPGLEKRYRDWCAAMRHALAQQH
ncbi:MAG: FGGY family carbohydrate kinase [Gammaproteobacteria bacterium]